MICRGIAGAALRGRVAKNMKLVEVKERDAREEVKWRLDTKKKMNLSQSLMFRAVCYFCSHSGEDKTGIIPLQNMQDVVKEDIKNNYRSYTQIRQSIVNHLAQQHYNRSNDTQLITILSLLSQYPIFPLPKATLLLIYKIICFNLHFKSVSSLNNLLLFVLVADQQASQSPIFHQFIRFYLQLTLEQFKFKYQLDFSSMSPLQAIKQFIGKLVHRGFMPRTPPYQRNLNILYHEQTLNLLVKNESVRSTQMVKKINYALFLDIKQFYETQMKENLYHPRKKELLEKFNSDYLRFLSEQVEMTHHETIHLRQLYMKLYVTLPDEKGELNVFKYKNTIFMYWLGMKHIQRLDHLKLQEIKEKIDIVIDYVQLVKENMLKLAQFGEEELEALSLNLEELLLIVKCLLEAGSSAESCGRLLNLIHNKTSPVLFYYYFLLFKDVLKHASNSQATADIISDYKNYEWLKLPQMLELFDCFESHRKQQRSAILTHILTKVLSTDFQLIGGQEIIIFLNIYQAFIDLNNEHINNDPQSQSAQQLRKFQMRYIADHHKQFSLKEFQEIVILLTKLPRVKCTDFDDTDNNYPNTIFQEIKPYFNKVSLLLSSQAKEALQILQRQKSTTD